MGRQPARLAGWQAGRLAGAHTVRLAQLDDAAFEHSLKVNDKARAKANASYARKPIDRLSLGGSMWGIGGSQELTRSSDELDDAAFERSLKVNEKARAKANASYARKPMERLSLGVSGAKGDAARLLSVLRRSELVSCCFLALDRLRSDAW